MKSKILDGKVARILLTILRIIGVFAAIYFFICSLSFLTSAALILLGKEGGKIFSESDIIKNPLVGLMIGVFATVIFQSSSTTTSIIVALVGATVFEVPQAIPMVMGANIGTSVTNTLVSFGQIGDRTNFRRAFAAATVHDMFNWLTVIILLPLEMATGYLEHLTEAIVNSFEIKEQEEIVLLEAVTKPFTELIISIDKGTFAKWSAGDKEALKKESLLKEECIVGEVYYNETHNITDYERCGYLFAKAEFDDVWIGVCLLIIALVMLVGCLGLLVKILNALMKAKLVDFIKNTLNKDLPHVPWLTGYVALIIGAVVTFVIQSSSVFTSTLTPLVGAGIFTIERAYVLTLGSNIGTCGTSLLAAMAVSDHLDLSLQIALCHLFFNVTGIVLYYPIPFMRWPIPLAQGLGSTVAKYRWFAIFYLLMMFIIVPAYVMGLSFIDQENYLGVYIGFVPLVVLAVFILIINVTQKRRPHVLPYILRNWDFLPECLHSLKPLDRFVTRLRCCAPESEKIDEAKTDGDSFSVSIDVIVTDEKPSFDSEMLERKMESLKR